MLQSNIFNQKVLGNNMKKTVSVYFPAGSYERISEEARGKGLSVSSYLIQCSDPLGPLFRKKGDDRLDRIEEKIDTILSVESKKTVDVADRIREKIEVNLGAAKISEEDAELLQRAQERVDGMLSAKTVEIGEPAMYEIGKTEVLEKKRTKIPNAIKTAGDLGDHFRPFSKSHQVGKK
jgi:hypothetical protein